MCRAPAGELPAADSLKQQYDTVRTEQAAVDLSVVTAR